jgi:MHS family proline/betaine transporter-like MFS transporter
MVQSPITSEVPMNNNNVMAETAMLPAEETEQTRKAKKATRAAVFGTFVEYYDFSVYGYVAATLAMVLVPHFWYGLSGLSLSAGLVTRLVDVQA